VTRHRRAEADGRVLRAVEAFGRADVSEDGPRKKVIDSAFEMVEQLVSASNQLAQNVVDLTEKALTEPGGASPAKETAAKR
jgi:hypothetical protein